MSKITTPTFPGAICPAAKIMDDTTAHIQAGNNFEVSPKKKPRSAISSPNPARINCIISSNVLSKDRIELVRPSTWSTNSPLKIKFPTTIVTMPLKHGTNAHAITPGFLISSTIVLKRNPDSAFGVLETASTMKKNAIPTNTE